MELCGERVLRIIIGRMKQQQLSLNKYIPFSTVMSVYDAKINELTQ